MSHLSDALTEYAQLGVIDRATVRRLDDAAARDLAEIRVERASVVASLLGELTDPNVAPDDVLTALSLVLSAHHAIRRDHDNLAGTVELCCAPVEGGDLRDRVRAAGEAQRDVAFVRARVEARDADLINATRALQAALGQVYDEADPDSLAFVVEQVVARLCVPREAAIPCTAQGCEVKP